jgi:hypothetical protein
MLPSVAPYHYAVILLRTISSGKDQVIFEHRLRTGAALEAAPHNAPAEGISLVQFTDGEKGGTPSTVFPLALHVPAIAGAAVNPSVPIASAKAITIV